MMVNYEYALEDVDANSAAYIGDAAIAATPSVRALLSGQQPLPLIAAAR